MSVERPFVPYGRPYGLRLPAKYPLHLPAKPGGLARSEGGRRPGISNSPVRQTVVPNSLSRGVFLSF